ncbi:hypothetical protein HZY97_14855 [Sphingomonas sp. R-74633]|uniref:hypothetical protein n=1 Tax=Sphingomonas sp. R-74633 TaxID=2751188 RepID=UPI0015D144D7|nr:hypothetical protein [Sphingomonas sp. R-74633]NYT42047.1 hypothetical protein [Sphingomonas sp. R-74633]
MQVYLLGAGASKAFDESPTAQRMPIARDFFDTFDKLTLSANPWVLIEGLVGYIEKKHGRGNAYAYLRSGIDIEDLHSEIEEARDRGLASGDPAEWYLPYRAYNELVFLFSAVLNDIQNGPVSKAHFNLITELAPGDVIITFNWDTLLDRALASATPWRPDWGYGVAPHSVFDDGWRAVQPDNDARGNRLIKLHGSTNWITGYSVTDGQGVLVPSQDLDPGAFAVFEQATKPYPCFAGRYMPGYEPYSFGYYPPNLDVPGRGAPEGHVIVAMRPKVPWRLEGTAPDGGLPSMPLIIPPVRNKAYTFFGELFGTLWKQAEDALAEADKITIIGYSFPRTDVQSDQLFRRAFARRTSMPRIDIVDPAPASVSNKMTADLGMRDDHLHVVEGYFSADFDFSVLA